jgi:hypothetical protein
LGKPLREMGIVVSELGKFSLIRGPGGRSERHGFGRHREGADHQI